MSRDAREGIVLRASCSADEILYAVTKLSAMWGEDPEREHAAADEILLELVPPQVRAAWEKAIGGHVHEHKPVEERLLDAWSEGYGEGYSDGVAGHRTD